ncbi:WAP four-disulfide core domain protein 2-like isoform X1 [Pomacea canaliculata]|uniref:WAP four-disulfide core domain protein 2-like isoform X1 n=1 Tax=Pomacea canaliculata TaxID=400727 RepID=UPI000D72A622|nr:WAP four-disulfide core domain protein 2-like isoform X1 [Pomacea canaliculata]XP_025098326.1 WAP four-disulfide core domain protein 2-like isoform X1 [Pomacea canaliculata]
MRVVVLLAVAVTMTYAQVPGTYRIICASTDCWGYSVCRKVLNTTSGEVVPICFDPMRYPPTGNEQVCSDGQPLWVITGTGDYSQASCGRVVNKTTCPSNYRCVTSPVDVYDVCCPNSDKIGECPETQPGEVGVCADLCQSDTNCPRDLKCCPNACGAHTCQTPVHSLTCEHTECGFGYVCQMTPKGPQCFYAIRDGKCPDLSASRHRFSCSSCLSDLDCPDFQKCCPGRHCRQCVPPEPSVTCANISCPRGQRCVMKKVICAKAPCFPVPTCV